MENSKDDVASRLNIDISKPLKADEVLPSIKQYERKSRYEIEEVGISESELVYMCRFCSRQACWCWTICCITQASHTASIPV